MIQFTFTKEQLSLLQIIVSHAYANKQYYSDAYADAAAAADAAYAYASYAYASAAERARQIEAILYLSNIKED